LENSFFSYGSECIGKVIKCTFYTVLLWNSTPGRSLTQLIFSISLCICVQKMAQHQFMVSPSTPRLIDAITQLYASQRSAPRRDATENKFPGFQRACTKNGFGWSFFYWISICRASVKNAWDGNTCIPVEHNTLNEIA
jgi:hypothetical protein